MVVSPAPSRHVSGSSSSSTDTIEMVQEKLVKVVENSLREAITKREVKNKILSSLFSDLSQKIEPEYKTVLEQQVARQSSSSSESNQKQAFAYYYELLADHYEKNSASASQTLLLCTQLVSNHHFPCIFACIFYRWLFRPENFTWKRYNLFLKGVNRIFWSDILLKEVRFRRVYKFIKFDIALKNVDGLFLAALKHQQQVQSDHVQIHSKFADDNEDTDDQEEQDDDVKQLNSSIEAASQSKASSSSASQTAAQPTEQLLQSNSLKKKNNIAAINHLEALQVLKTKKLDLISLLAKYFFFYELKSGKTRIYTYIQTLSQLQASHQIIPTLISTTTTTTTTNSSGGASNQSPPASPTYSSTIPNSPISAASTAAVAFQSTSAASTVSSSLYSDHDLTRERANTQLIADMFVQENLLILNALREESILLQHLQHFQYFSDLMPFISPKMRSKLQATLYTLSTPGGPIAPSRLTRYAALEMQDKLFPNGKYGRMLLNTTMRVFHQPILWPQHLFKWFLSQFWSFAKLPVSMFQWFSSSVKSSILGSQSQQQRADNDNLSSLEEQHDRKIHDS